MNRINEIGDTPKGQDALGQVHGRAIKRRQMLGDKGAISRKLNNTARDAQHKAYTQGKKHGFDIYDPNGSFDKGVSKGYQKAKTNESTLQKIVKDVVNKTIKESDELDANDWKARYLKNAHYPNEPVDMKDIENKASWETFDDNVNSLYGQRGCYDDDYASQAYADDPLSDFYGLENKNTYDLKGYLAKRKLNKLTKNESKDINKKLIKLTEGDLHKIVKESVKRVVKESIPPMGLGKPSFDSKHIGVIKAVRNLVNELEKVGAEDWIIQQAYEIEHQFVDSYGDNGISDEMLR